MEPTAYPFRCDLPSGSMTSQRTLSAVTMTVLVALLVVGAVVGWRALSAPTPGSEEEPVATGPSCEDGLAKGEVVHSGDVTVSVYNAGSRSGLAGQTQDQLLARGFIPGDIANAPEEFADVRFVRILSRSKSDPAARLVALQFGANTAIQVAPDLGPGVEVVVGNDFVGLVDAPRRLKAKARGSGC